jgi:uncharacterized protein (TIGR02266 family)
MALKELSSAIRKYVSYRQRLRAGEQLPQDEMEDYYDHLDYISLFLARKAGEKPAVTIRNGRSRTTLRVPAAVTAQLASSSDLRECMALNISEGGIFLATDNPDLAPGTPVRLEIVLREEKSALKLSGVVQWQSTGSESPLLSGIGIRFTGLTTAQKKALEQFVDGRTESLLDLLA